MSERSCFSRHSPAGYCGPYARECCWDGRYFATILTPDGKLRRQDAAEPLPPGGCTVVAVDNGLQDRAYYRQTLRELRARVKSGEIPLPTPGQRSH